LTDSVNGKKNEGKAKETVQVLDVAQLLLDSVKTPADPQDGEGPEGPGDAPKPQDEAHPQTQT
ncbi:hypothetical protein, partial [Streptomyces galbus]